MDGDGEWHGHVWLLHVFALPCLAAGGRRRLWALADILSLKWTWESRKTPAQELVPKETRKRSWKLDAGTRGDISLAQSPLLPSERGPILCDLAVGWLVKRPQSGSLPAGRSCPALGNGKDATPPVWRLFLAGRWPRPIDAIRVMMRGGNVWCLHRVLAARGHAGGAAAAACRTRVQNPPSAPQQTKIACGKSRPTTSWCGARGRPMRSGGISPPACFGGGDSLCRRLEVR